MTTFPIGIDARALTLPDFVVDGGSRLPTATVGNVMLAPGPHTLGTVVGSSVEFEVSETGAIELDPRLPFASGSGSASLLVTGYPVSIDARSTGASSFVLGDRGSDLTVTRDAAIVQPVSALPGGYVVRLPDGARLEFDVTGRGLVAFADGDPALGGEGSTVLVVGTAAQPVDRAAASALAQPLPLGRLATPPRPGGRLATGPVVVGPRDPAGPVIGTPGEPPIRVSPPEVDPGRVLGRPFDPGSLSDVLDPEQLKVVMARLQPVLGHTKVEPGATVPAVNVNPELLQRLLLPALVSAAGLDPAATSTPPLPILWDTGADRLVVHLAGATLRSGDGFVDITLTVECDETAATQVVSTFVTTTPDRPGGLAWSTEDRPRGAAVVVDVWGDALVALAWRALIDVSRQAAASQGTDTFDRPLLAANVVATANGFQVISMAAHPFMTIRTDRR